MNQVDIHVTYVVCALELARKVSTVRGVDTQLLSQESPKVISGSLTVHHRDQISEARSLRLPVAATSVHVLMSRHHFCQEQTPDSCQWRVLQRERYKQIVGDLGGSMSENRENGFSGDSGQRG